MFYVRALIFYAEVDVGTPCDSAISTFTTYGHHELF